MAEPMEYDHSNANPLVSEAELLAAIERVIRMTKKAYGYQHLSTIASYLREQYPGFNPADYGCKTLLQMIERYPERFKIKWSAPAHKGRSHVWIRLATEPKRKEGYGNTNVQPPQPQLKPRLMTVNEFTRLCEWLDGPQGCNFRYDPARPDDPEGITWDCDGTLRKTRQWLKRRPFLSVEANLKLIRQLGGHCDCEILFNASGNWPED